jgi:acyl-CoA-binding protein
MAGVPTEDKLVFYGLYKQATAGPCNMPSPSCFAWSDKAKWQRWHDLGDLSPALAARRYIEHLDSMQDSWRSSMPPQLQDLGMQGGDSSEHLSSSEDDETPAHDRPSKVNDSSGDSPWREDSTGARVAPECNVGSRSGDNSQAGLRMEQRMRLQAPTVPPAGVGLPELGLRAVHEEHADQLKFARLMDLLKLQEEGKYVAELEDPDTQRFMEHFYERLANISDVAPYAIPPRNYSLTGRALAEAKKERQYLWELLTCDMHLPVVADNATEGEEDARFQGAPLPLLPT